MAVTVELDRPTEESGVHGCEFCTRLRLDVEQVVAADDHFVAWVSAGPLAEGHVLALPREHALNCAQLEYPLLQSFVSQTKRLLEAYYGPIALFEHGPQRPGTAVGCSVDHAHLHLLPWGGSLIAPTTGAHPNLLWGDHDGLEAALHHVRGSDYLLVVDPDERVATATGTDIGSQALRRVVACELGRPEEWNWKTHPRVETQVQTLKTLQLR